MKYIETQLSLLLITLSSQNMLYSQRQKSICVNVSWHAMLGSATSRQHFHENKKSNQIKSLTFEELWMFSLRRLPVRSQMFFISQNIIFVGEIAPFVLHVWLRNRPENAVTTTPNFFPNQLHNIDRNMANVVQNQSSRCFSHIYSVIYPSGQLVSHQKRLE